jgi:hypothetical protein
MKTMRAEAFLEDHPGERPWQSSSPSIRARRFFLGKGASALEVAVAHATKRPGRGDVRQIWNARHGGAASPLLLVVLWEDLGDTRAWLCGPVGDEPPVFENLDASQAERIAQTALAEPDRHSAIRLLKSALPETESELPGLHNVGMFATYHLRERVPARPDWSAMVDRGRTLLKKGGRDLVEGLGFDIEARGATTNVLRIRENGQASAVAIFLDESESPEALSSRFPESTPVSTALARATAENVKYVVLTRGREIRLYGATTDVGVGRKGRAETFVQANLSLLPAERAGYLPLIFGADALRPGGTFETILEHSRDFAAGIGERLRDRVYDEVVPALAQAVGRAHKKAHPDEPLDTHLDELYETAMTILFRLLFVAYAEDKGLLPYEKNERYREHALKTLARGMASAMNDGTLVYDTGALTYWHRAEELWRAVDRGSPAWGIPMYNGGLFSNDPDVSPVGARIAALEITDEVFGPALFDLLVEKSGDDEIVGPVDFAALSVREFGTIYEGLLESSLAIAKENLTRDRNGRYVPTADEAQIKVHAGEAFLQGNDGARKATGSYFTPHFAVEYLLDHSLMPALQRHLAEVAGLLEQGKEGPAAREFFNFRVADISMGSGHFLVAAVDRIEAAMSDFLERHRLPGVVEELERLRGLAKENLGPWGEGDSLERASLLRRQIARRCIYGVDINHVAVELARVSLWIHTFVEGLPLSFLDRSLVHGDSLFGAANGDEARRLLAPDDVDGQGDIFGDMARAEIDAVQGELDQLARSSDATEAEIKGARAAFEEVRSRLTPLREALDIAVASTVDASLVGEWRDHVGKLLRDGSFRGRVLRKAEPKLLQPRSIHFPLEFPEVFYRGQGGFDCIVGNPPWEKVMLAEDEFWMRYRPGLQGLSETAKRTEIKRLEGKHPELVEALAGAVAQVRAMRAFLSTERFPGMGESHADLFKAFAWRFLGVSAETGVIGVVMPRSLFQGAGTALFRAGVLDGGWDVALTTLENNRGWVFPEVHPQYSVVLVALRRRTDQDGVLHLSGPFKNASTFAKQSQPATMPADAIRSWNPQLVIPVLPSPGSSTVLAKMMGHKRIGDSGRGDFEVRPIQGDFNSTTGKIARDPENGAIVIAEAAPKGHVPVIGGEAFDVWTFDPARVYGWADPERADRILYERRLNQAKNKRSAFYGLPVTEVGNPDTLPSRSPRIAFRRIARATDSRTMRPAVVPEGVYLTDVAPYFYRVHGSARTDAYLLAVLSSRVFDWAARRYAEIHMNFFVLNPLPVPTMRESDPLVDRAHEIAGALSCQQEELATWAKLLGRPIERVDTATHADHEAELDAVVGHLYGLDEEDLTHIMETLHTGWNHESHLQATLQHYRMWSGKVTPTTATS